MSSTRFVLCRRGARGDVHVGVERKGAILTACGRTMRLLTPTSPLVVWRSQRLIRAVWAEDDTRRCLDCSRTTSAAPSPRGRRQVR
jgi:hypothetical protein